MGKRKREAMLFELTWHAAFLKPQQPHGSFGATPSMWTCEFSSPGTRLGGLGTCFVAAGSESADAQDPTVFWVALLRHPCPICPRYTVCELRVR